MKKCYYTLIWGVVMKNLIKKIKNDSRLLEIISYVFFGGMTTVVNFVVYFIARSLLDWSLVVSNTLSWIFAVLFAFVTNKIWVFGSKTNNFKSLFFEFSKFVFYRLLSFGIDMLCMLLFVNVIHTGDFIAKLLTQIFIVIANYVFSKFFIFKGTRFKEGEK